MLAFTFPGQGSQRSGMGQTWRDHPSWEVVEEASNLSGKDVTALLLDADQDELTLTANAQLSTFVLSLVILDAIERVGLAPTRSAGHSLGEFTALTASGAVSFEDGVRLVTARGNAMHEAAKSNPGTMAAVLGADDEVVETACEKAQGDVWVANYNAPGQVVIAGVAEAVSRASILVKELGAKKVMPFAVAGAFHTALMAPALETLVKSLAETTFQDPEIPVVANVDAQVHDAAVDWPSLLSAQLCSPVRWRQTLDTLAAMGTTTLVEVGHGGILTGLTRRTLPDVKAMSVSTPDDLDVLVETLAGAEAITAYAAAHQGEHLFTSERVVVAPAAGVFETIEGMEAPGPGQLSSAAGPVLSVGDSLGRVGTNPVLTPFAGHLVGFLVHKGERVVPGQPVAWIRVSAGGS